jgi:quercetin dioxygenase-like cupin family protein
MKKLLLAVLLTAFVVTPSLAQEMAKPTVMENPDAIEWMAAPPFLNPGAQMAVIQGDPSADGVYTLRLRFPAGYEIRPHTHPTIENVTIVSGAMHVSMGSTWDTSGGLTLGTGGFVSIPAEAPHFAWTTEPVEIQIHGMGPFAFNYVNPEDAPDAAAR